MEKNIKKRIIIGCASLGFLVILCLVIWGGCSYNRYMHDPTYPGTQVVGADPDDAFSQNVVSTIDDAYLYFGKEVYREKTQYFFYLNIRSIDSNALFVDAVNRFSEYAQGKTEIIILCGSGIYDCVYSLQNYNDESTETSYSNDFYYLSFGNDWDWLSSELSDYSCIEGISIVEMPDVMQEKADEEGIDWYEIGPDLDEVIVYETE